MYRYAIVGFGGLGKKHLCNMKKIEWERGDFCLAAICGTTAEKAKESVTTNIGTSDMSDMDFSLCNFYQDYKEMIDNENIFQSSCFSTLCCNALYHSICIRSFCFLC